MHCNSQPSSALWPILTMHLYIHVLWYPYWLSTGLNCTLKLDCFYSLLCLTVTKENPSGAPNLEVWTSEKVAEFVQKKHQEWYGT